MKRTQHWILIICDILTLFAVTVTAEEEGHKGSSVVNIAGYEARVCHEASCVGRCGDGESPLCQCDDVCMLLGDCCLDYQPVCLRNTTCNFTTECLQITNLTEDYLRRSKVQEAVISKIALFTLYRVGKVTLSLSHPGIVITQCPHAYTGNRDLCANSTYADYTVHVILLTYSKSSKLIFKNEYCAACHGYMDIIHIDAEVRCTSTTAKKALPWYIDSNLDNFLRSITNKAVDNFQVSFCQMHIDLYPLPLPLWRYKFGKRRCYQEVGPSESYELYKIAYSYRSPFIPAMYQSLIYDQQDNILQRRSYYTYRNWHEVLCRGHNVKDLVCTNDNFTYYPPATSYYADKQTHPRYLPLILSYKKEITRVHYDQQLICPKTHVAEVVNEICMEKTKFCPVAHVPWNGYCHKVSLSSQDTVQGLYNSRIDIFVATARYVNISLLPNNLQAILVLNTVGSIQKTWVELNCSILLDVHLEHCLLLMLHGPPTNKLFSVSNFGRYRNALFREIKEVVGNVMYIGMKNYKSSAIYCVNSDVHWLINPAVVTNATYYYQFYETDALRIIDPERGRSYTSTMAAVLTMWQISSDVHSPDLVPFSVHAAVCMTNTSLLSCTTLVIPAQRYAAHNSGDKMHITLLQNGKKKIQVDKKQVIVDKKNTLIMCESVFHEAMKASSTKLNPALILSLGLICIMLTI